MSEKKQSAEEVRVCAPMVLPLERQIEASATAIAENQLNMPLMGLVAFVNDDVPLTPEHLTVIVSRYWGRQTRKIPVSFMESTPADLARRIVEHANHWSEHCGISFVLSRSGGAVRITRAQEGYWSYIGTDILTIPWNQPTMCLSRFNMGIPESEFDRVVDHEFGHTLGFPHEHMREEHVRRIDPQKAIAYFGRTQGWGPAMVKAQVLTPLDKATIYGTEADQESIMAYQLPAEIMRDGKPYPGGARINTTDAAFAGRIYPKAGRR